MLLQRVEGGQQHLNVVDTNAHLAERLGGGGGGEGEGGLGRGTTLQKERKKAYISRDCLKPFTVLLGAGHAVWVHIL